MIGQSGNVEADIVADDITVSGKIVGNVTAKSKLEITSTGTIRGDVKTARLIMEDGGKLDGRSEMPSDGKSPVTEKPKAEGKPGDAASKKDSKQPTPSRA